MRKVRGVRKYLYVGVAAAAMLAASIGVWRAHADEGYSDEIQVTINSIAGDGPLTIYTPDPARGPGSQLQTELPILVRMTVGREPVAFGQTLFPALDATIITGGSVDVTGGVPEVVDPVESLPAELERFSTTGSQYLSVIDVSQLEYESVNIIAGVSGFAAEDFLRAVATVDSYYINGTTTTDLAQEPMDITVLDTAFVDDDGNGIPDATALLEPFTVMIGPEDNVTYVVDLGDLNRGDSFNGNVTFGLRTDNGPVQVSVSGPTMAQLEAADAAYELYAGRLIVSVATDPIDLVDLPIDADPLAEFDLSNEPPRGFFIRTLIALTDAVDARGAVPQWTFLDELPEDLTIEIEISGPGVINQLNDGDLGFGYLYTTQATQSGEDILIESADGWAEVADFDVANFYNGDEFVPGRGSASVEEGDDSLFFSSQSSSAIFASNLAADDDGGGGSSGCFIATAAYGTPMAMEIESLRGVRDAYLLDSVLGSAFVDTYYRISPPIARMVSEYPAAKAVVRALLAPLVAIGGWSMASPGIVAAIGLVMLIAAIAGVRRIVRVLVHRQ